MKRVLILPGYSQKNRQWMEDTQRFLNSKGFEALIHPWKHWEGGEFKSDDELTAIASECGESMLSVIAKSVGTRIAAEIVSKKILRVEKLILCGIPYHWQPDTGEPIPEHYRQALERFPSEELLCIQNDQDPYAPFESVEKLLKSINKNITVVSKESDTHEYPYFEDFSSFLSS